MMVSGSPSTLSCTLNSNKKNDRGKILGRMTAPPAAAAEVDGGGEADVAEGNAGGGA